MGEPAPQSLVTKHGVAALRDESDSTAPTLVAKHVLRSFPTSQYEKVTGILSTKVIELVLSDGDEECKCFLLDTKLVDTGALSSGSVVTVVEASKHMTHDTADVVVVTKLKLATESKVNDAEIFGGKSDPEAVALPLLGDRNYYLDLKYDDISPESAAYILRNATNFESSVESLCQKAFHSFMEEHNRPPLLEEALQLNAGVELPITAECELLGDLVKIPDYKGTFIGRITRMGRRRHFGKVFQANKCPFGVHLVISDRSYSLPVACWGTLAILVHAQLQIGDIVSISNTGKLRRFNNQLELPVNSSHPPGIIRKETDVSLVAFSLEERMHRWPLEPPRKLREILQTATDAETVNIAGLVSYVGPVFDSVNLHPHAEALTIDAFRWIMVRDESLPGVQRKKQKKKAHSCADILVGLYRNSQDDPFFDITPGQIMFISDLRVVRCVQSSMGPAPFHLCSSANSRMVVCRHGSVGFEVADSEATKNKALHRFLNCNLGFQRLCAWWDELRPTCHARTQSNASVVLEGSKFAPLNSSFFLTGDVCSDVRHLLSCTGEKRFLGFKPNTALHQSNRALDKARSLPQPGQFAYCVVEATLTNITSNEEGQDLCSVLVDGQHLYEFILSPSPTLRPALLAGYSWMKLLPTNKNPLWQIMAPVLRFMGASGINFVRESMPRRTSSTHLDIILNFFADHPLVIVVRCGKDSDGQSQLFVEGLNFRGEE